MRAVRAAPMPKRYLVDGAKSIPLDVLETGLFPEFLRGTGGRETTPATLYQGVAYLYRCVDVRANALSAVPWALYKGDTEVVTNDADVWPQELSWCANLEDLIWQTEAALCLTAAAYWHKLRNVRRGAVGLQWFDPTITRPVWGPQGITSFERTLADGRKDKLPVEDVVYLRLLGASETEPRPAPAAAAWAAAGVLYNTDEFVSAYFKRGAIKATILTVDGNPLPAERERLKSWWQRFISGIDRAFTAEVVSAQVSPIIVGEGLSELTNVDLTTSRREDIATAFGVPHSVVMSNAANFATANADRLNFYDMTILPECNLISRQANAQLFAPLGYRLEFRPEQLPIYQADENERAAAFAAYVNAGLKPSIVAQMLGLSLPEGITPEMLDPEPEPQPQTITVLPPQAAQPAQLADSQQEQRGRDTASDARAQEARKLIRWARGKRQPDVTRFASDVLSDEEKRAILAGVNDGEGEEGRQGGQGWGLQEIDSLDAWAAYKAMLLVHDPGDDNTPEEQALLAIEGQSQREIARALRKQFKDILPPDAESMDIVQLQNYIEQRVGNQAVRDAINAAVRRAADVGVNIAADQMAALNVGFDYTLIHTAARDWAQQYSGQLITRIEDTTLAAVRESVGRWYTNGEPLNALTADLSSIFDEKRAKLIAMTETTHSAAQGTMRGYEASGVVKAMVWLTANDERVCPYCGALDGAIVALDGKFSDALPPELQAKLKGRTFQAPPAHPGCRCRIGAQVIEVGADNA